MSDVIIVGAGHNGLVAATVLSRAGLKVHVLEDQPVIGGACRTEYPFKKAPRLGSSTGAYLLGLMPPEIMERTGVKLPLRRRDPHYFLPTTDGRYLLFGSDEASMKQQFISFFSEADWRANQAMNLEIGQIRDDIGPTWLEEPLSIEETADKYVRPNLRTAFIDLCRLPVGAYLDRWGFKSDLLRAMYAVTDGFSGTLGTFDTPGTGMNFLVHNMCRLPGADGTWMICEGGMGTVTTSFANAARAHGAVIECNARVERFLVEGGSVRGVALTGGRELRAKVVVTNSDPFRMLKMADFPEDYRQRIDGYRRPGSTLKLNLALKGLPKFSCLSEDRGQFGSTIHLLPDEKDVVRSLSEGFAAVKDGRLADFPTIEWYIHTTVDPSLRDGVHHNSALFVQWVPMEVKGSSWDAEVDGYARHLLSICDRFAPGTSELVADMFVLHPKKIEQHFGMTNGHIHHVDNSFGFTERLPYVTPIAGLYSCSAGCHPAGAIIGAAGHNAAQRVLKDLS